MAADEDKDRQESKAKRDTESTNAQGEATDDQLDEVAGGRKAYDLNPNDLSVKIELGNTEKR